VIRPAGTRRADSGAAQPDVPTLAQIRRLVMAAVSQTHGIQLDDVHL